MDKSTKDKSNLDKYRQKNPSVWTNNQRLPAITENNNNAVSQNNNEKRHESTLSNLEGADQL